jgi:hypothetical protein
MEARFCCGRAARHCSREKRLIISFQVDNSTPGPKKASVSPDDIELLDKQTYNPGLEVASVWRSSSQMVGGELKIRPTNG